ncbi:dihydrolipoyl dehydrogenase [Mesoterricola sediminis]|uniref:Dihydrolipoyl dehydrogenase n=1 Tax=Mesoterricola sediminis TaxID=2927980 RepID=A0AA48KDV9_9BACT|nr:dihydrolipoyl dehydrogenase [Mesoterricola sediminis]BDU78621.1 dihydrolipoyl dehydrogenase [Mesoterricola sediminis]
MAQFDLIVIGSGPGGYVAAIRGAQLGLSTAIVEKDSGLGGTCLWRGCIPAKTWLETAHRFEQMSDLGDYGIAGVDVSALKADLATIVKRKNRIVTKNGKGVEFLMKKNKISVLKGFGKLLGGGKVDVAGEVHEAKRIILATGSVPRELPGLEADGKRVLNSDHLLDMTELPSHLVILGAGAIGVEFASVFARLGSKVTLVELMDRLLPIEDAAVGEELAKILAKRHKMDIRVKTKIASVERLDDKVVCHLEGEKGGVVEGSHLLVAVGRGPVTAGVGLEATRAVVEKGFVGVDAFMATAEPGLYAIGDIVRTPMLAHVASDEGIVAAEHAARSLGKDVHPHPINYDRVPSVTYCDPEVGCIGLSEAAAKERGHDVQTGSFPFMPLAKANIVGEPHGFVKIVADRKYGEILGIHIIGPKATELVASSLALLGGEYTVEELINTMYPHPTLNEAIPEAARAVQGRAINA